MSDITYEEYQKLSDEEIADLDLTPEQLQEFIDREIRERSMSPLEKLRESNPALKEAWDQIKTIRALTEKQQAQIDAKPSWERRYFEIVEGVTTDNAALKEAWDRYYLLKRLIADDKN